MIVRRSPPTLRFGAAAFASLFHASNLRPGLACRAVARSEAKSEGWCAREDLNLHALRHQILSLACLPFHHARNPNYRGYYRNNRGVYWLWTTFYRYCHVEPIETTSKPGLHTNVQTQAIPRHLTYQKIGDARKQPIRGLWAKNGQFYLRLIVDDPLIKQVTG